MKFADIGQQLRAYRLESGLRAARQIDPAAKPDPVERKAGFFLV